MLKMVEDILAATAPEHVVCQLCDEVIQEGCRSLSLGLFQCKTLDKRCEAAQKIPDMKANDERYSLSDMDKVQVHRPRLADGQ